MKALMTAESVLRESYPGCSVCTHIRINYRIKHILLLRVEGGAQWGADA